MQQPRQPEWHEWCGRSSLRAWEALALSVDIEPRDLGVDHFLVMRSSETGRSLLGDQDPAWLAELCQRLGELLKALAEAPPGLRAGRGKAVAFDAELKLGGFAAWASSRQWKLPEALASLAPAAASKPASQGKNAKPANTAKKAKQAKASKSAKSGARAAKSATPKRRKK